ncbi:MAG: hypothetical protein M3Y50_01735 [Acidobacteriota bacterium]|nr:hypothetical protein [Acidobacteriota bacterium]
MPRTMECAVSWIVSVGPLLMLLTASAAPMFAQDRNSGGGMAVGGT